MRHSFLITREWVKRRAAILREQEDAVIRAAHDEAKTDEQRHPRPVARVSVPVARLLLWLPAETL